MKIAGWKKVSFIDYPGKNSTIVFTPGCNYRCPTCHDKHLVENRNLPNINEEEIFKYLDSRKGKITAIVICGGEPTLQPDLANFAGKAKEKGLSVKLDTNGSNYVILGDLLAKGLFDYVAMDVKAPSYLYKKVTCRDNLDPRDVEKGISVVSQFPNYEFRTTIVPIYRRGGEKSFMTIREVCDIAKWIVGATNDDSHKYILQPFVPRKGELIDSGFESFPKTPTALLEEMKKEVRKYLPNCEIRQP